MRKAFNHLPEQDDADRNQADGVEEIGGAQEPPGKPLTQCVREDEESEGHLVGEIVDPIDDETQAAGLNATDQLDDQHEGVQEKRARQWAATMRHGADGTTRTERCGPAKVAWAR